MSAATEPTPDEAPTSVEAIVISDSEEETEPISRRANKRAASPETQFSSNKRTCTVPTSEPGVELIVPPVDQPELRQWKNKARAAEHAYRTTKKAMIDQINTHKTAETLAKAAADALRQERDQALAEQEYQAERAERAEVALIVDAEVKEGGVEGGRTLLAMISCEICHDKMWSPWMLPGCGHIFCRSCLMEWFSTIHVKHLSDHPTYDVKHQLPRLSSSQATLLPEPIQAFFAQANSAPRPTYSCPTCRKEVTTKPAEAFVIKEIVQYIADRSGLPNPDASRSFESGGKGKGRASASALAGPWDGFFVDV